MSLNNRIEMLDNASKVAVRPDPMNPDRQLWYRIIKLDESVVTDQPFAKCAYHTVLELRNREVLELKEDDGESILKAPDNFRPKFSVSVHSVREGSELSLSTNAGLHISRVMLEDPQKQRYVLGMTGTLNEKNTWYLPQDVSFSKSKEGNGWHIKLDKYSDFVYQYVIK